MTVKDKFDSMDYGQALESDSAVRAWLSDHDSTMGHFIDGTWVKGSDHLTSFDPATGEAIAEIAVADSAQIDMAVQAARQAQPVWQALGGHGRAKILYAIARLVQKHSRFLAVLETLDNGKPIRESRDIDIPLVARHFYHHAGWAETLEDEFSGHKPHGVVAQIIPWNFPLLMLAWKVAPALAAGNTVVLKPAEYTSLTALRFAALCKDAGVPAGVVNIITGAGDTGAGLVAHGDIDKVAFTGSTSVGRAIAQQLAGSGVALTLELGGKSPYIVFEDADIDSAVEGLVDAIWFNQGEVCCAGSRLLVQEGIEERFTDKLKQRMAKIRLGAPMDKAIDMGTIIDPSQLERIEKLVAESASEGATVWQAPCDLPETGSYYPPTLLMDAGPDNTGYRDEIFGPVLSVSSFRTQAEAVKLANASRYGLAASVWSEGIGRALEVAAAIKAGVVWINGSNMFDAAVGFGGYRESGFGREGGAEGMKAYLKPDWALMENRTPSSQRFEMIKNAVDRTPKHYIGGKQVRADSGYSLEVFDAVGASAGLVAEGKPKDVRSAVEAARGALSSWANMTAHGRAQILYFLAENLSLRVDELSRKIQSYDGLSAEAANNQLAAAIQRIFGAAAMADKYDGRIHTPPMKGLALAVHEPIGVMGIVGPDRDSLMAMLTLISHAVAAGNTVVAVPGMAGSLIAADILQVIETSDVPAGVINILSGDQAAMVKTLAGHSDVDGIWHLGPDDLTETIQYEASQSMTRTWCPGNRLDLSPVGSLKSRDFMEKAVEVKNIWIPWGDAMSGGGSY